MNQIRIQYGDAFHFYRHQVWRTFLIGFAVFVVVAAGAAILLQGRPDDTADFIRMINEMFEKKGLEVNGQISAWRLLLNNLMASGLMVILGLVPFLFLPLIAMAENAFLIGVMFAGAGLMGVNWSDLALGLIPHGVFELPAVFLSVGLGAWLCGESVKKILGRNKERTYFFMLAEVSRFFVLVIIPLLIAAALVEAYVTPVVMRWAV